MDLDHPAAFFSAILIGLIGTVLFIYGRKQQSVRCLLAGAALCIFPYFITSVAVMWAVTGGCLGGLYYLSRG